MNVKTIFSPDFVSEKTLFFNERTPIQSPAAILGEDPSPEALARGQAFADELESRFVADFENKHTDQMAHVSTFVFRDGMIYMSYYANTSAYAEDPTFQTARLAYCPADRPEDMTFLDIQSVGEPCYDGEVVMVYDTILMPREDSIFILWTASISGKYYRLYRIFDPKTRTLGPVQVNRFRVGSVVNDFSTTGIRNALAEAGQPCKTMYSDIGIMQKLSGRMENGVFWYYSGTYSGDFNCIIKSRDFIEWEYVAQPGFPNESKWENAVYVFGSKCYYLVRQHDDVPYAFLTAYDLDRGTWDTPVLVADCQSRSDFIVYRGKLYLFHAPVDREHIGIIAINTENLADSRVVLQSHIHTSCFYPFIQYGEGDELYMSYTIARKHIRLAGFTLSRYLD